MTDRYACDSCRVLFNGRPPGDECPVCEHQGNMVEYVNGSKSRSDWYSIVWDGEVKVNG